MKRFVFCDRCWVYVYRRGLSSTRPPMGWTSVVRDGRVYFACSAYCRALLLARLGMME